MRKGWANPSSLQWLGAVHLYSSKMLSALVTFSQNRRHVVVPLCQSLSCLSADPDEHKVLCMATARMWARTSPHTLQTSPSLTLYFLSTSEHCPGKTLTPGETTADSFSIEGLIFSHVISGFHASNLHFQVKKEVLLMNPLVTISPSWNTF